MPEHFDGEALFFDHESNHKINPEWEIADSPTSDSDSEEAPKKMTAFSMFEHFREHTRHAIIDGAFHLYHEVEKCYLLLQFEISN